MVRRGIGGQIPSTDAAFAGFHCRRGSFAPALLPFWIAQSGGCGRHAGGACGSGWLFSCAPVRALRYAAAACYFRRMSAREAPAVDLTLRLEVLAVCAVFVFVGAILLGAFW